MQGNASRFVFYQTRHIGFAVERLLLVCVVLSPCLSLEEEPGLAKEAGKPAKFCSEVGVRLGCGWVGVT